MSIFFNFDFAHSYILFFNGISMLQIVFKRCITTLKIELIV